MIRINKNCRNLRITNLNKPDGGLDDLAESGLVLRQGD